MVYLYHVILLVHFIGKKALNLPLFVYRSLGKMADKVQATQSNQSISFSIFLSLSYWC